MWELVKKKNVTWKKKRKHAGMKLIIGQMIKKLCEK